MSEPLDFLKTADNPLFEAIDHSKKLAFAPGALSTREKLLIAMALDALEGSVDGVRALGQAALEKGATPEQITETLRVAYYIGGVATTYVAAEALTDVLTSPGQNREDAPDAR